jgi:hypothetical protein
MIIWGSKAQDKTINRGGFFCPSCKAQTAYSHQRVSRYFTLYFIPLFPTSTLGEYIRCGSCSAQLRPEVLQLTREQIVELTSPWTCPACGNKNAPSEKGCLACGTGRNAQPPRLPAEPSMPSTPPPLPESAS